MDKKIEIEEYRYFSLFKEFNVYVDGDRCGTIMYDPRKNVWCSYGPNEGFMYEIRSMNGCIRSLLGIDESVELSIVLKVS